MQLADLSSQNQDRYNWRILLVDDDEDDYILLLDMLETAQEVRSRLEWASSFEAGRDAIKTGTFDAVLMNYDLGAHSGIDLIREAALRKNPAPILLLSGRGHPEADIEALRAGAADYLYKDDLNPHFLERSIRYAIERRRGEEELRLSEARFNKAFNATPDALVISRLEDGLIHEINDSFIKLFGYSREEVIGKTSLDLQMLADPADREEAIKRLNVDQSIRNIELAIRTKAGESRQASLSTEILNIHNEICLLTIIQDITERKQAEAALHEAHERAAWLARFPDENPNPVIRVAADGQILYCNPVAKQLSGWECDDNQQVSNPLLLLIREAFANQKDVEGDVRFGDRIFSFSVMPFMPEGYVNLYGRDVTHRRQAEETLTYQAKLLELVHDTIIAMDDQMNITFWNKAAERLYGWSKEEALGQNAAQLLQSELRGTERERVIKQSQETGLFQGEVVHHTKEGSRLVIEARMSVQKDSSGRVVGYLTANRDVTERRQAEDSLRQSEAQLRKSTEALHESEDRFAIIFEKSAFAAVLSTFPKAVLVDVNEAWEKMFGYTRREAIGKTSLELGLILDAQNRAQLIDQITEQRTLRDLEMSFQTKSGERRVVWLNIDVVDIGGEPYILNTMTDITERKQAEAALAKALNEVENEKNRLLAMMEALPIGVVIVDAQGGIVQSNKEYERVWGGSYPTTQSVADYGPFKAWWVDTSDPVQPEEWASALAVHKGETVLGQLIEIQRFDGTHGIILNSGAPIRDSQGQITGCVVGIMDITEQKRLEAEQREHNIQVEIQRRLLEYREQERQALARDLHDGPVQDLASLLFNVQFAKEAITDPAVKVELDQIAARLKTTVQNLREVMNEMRPPSLIRFGLAKAMNVFLEEFREKHPEIVLDTSLMDDGSCLSEPARLSLYRILQEALTNAVKHANANKVVVALICEDHHTILEIQDDGRGFSLSDNLVDYSIQGHYGLVGMKERAEAVGGKIEYISMPEKGTTIRVIVPLP